LAPILPSDQFRVIGRPALQEPIMEFLLKNFSLRAAHLSHLGHPRNFKGSNTSFSTLHGSEQDISGFSIIVFVLGLKCRREVVSLLIKILQSFIFLLTESPDRLLILLFDLLGIYRTKAVTSMLKLGNLGVKFLNFSRNVLDVQYMVEILIV
jgi:hypothetical protein